LLNLNLLLWTALIPVPHRGGRRAPGRRRRGGPDRSGPLLWGAAADEPGLWSAVRLDHPHRPPPAPTATPGGGASGPPAGHARAGRLYRRLGPVVGVGAACPGLVWAHGPVLRLRPGVGARGRGARVTTSHRTVSRAGAEPTSSPASMRGGCPPWGCPRRVTPERRTG